MPWSELAGRWSAWAGLAALFAAFTTVLAKLGLSGIDATLATWLRTVLVALLLSALMLGTGQLSLESARAMGGLPPRSLLALGLSAVTTGLSWLCYFRALQMGPAAPVAALDKVSVVLVALLGVALLGEQPEPLAWAGIALMAGGAVLVALA
ncbi:MAG: EamA family transporter [Cyanobacteriota bacterium]|nr:EamA family transporter [Cyanobacteriota bacterium]